MSDYTPDEEQVREQYTREQPPQIGTAAEKRDEFDRFIAKVKADAQTALIDRLEALASGFHFAGDLSAEKSLRGWIEDARDRIERGER